MPDYAWPDAEHRTLIGKRISRVDSPAKVSGQAKYTYDVHRPGMLYGKVLRSPYAHAKLLSVDISAAEKMPGVKAVHVVQGPGSTIHWEGDEIVAVAAVDELTAEDAVRAIKVEYQQLPYLVTDTEPPQGSAEGQGPLSMDDIDDMLDNQVPSQQMVNQIQQYGITAKPSEDTLKGLKSDGATDAVLDAIRAAAVHPEAGSKPKSNYQKTAAQTLGDPDKAFAEAEVVSEGLYGVPVITHCCLESHGSISEWTDADHLFTHISTQNVSGIAGQMAEPLKTPASNIRVHQDHVGGGFGSKFSPDRWGIFTAQISKKADGKPVRIMLERAAELKVAGARPSAYARVKVGAKKDGTVVAWQSQSWGTGGPGGGGMPPIPYVFAVPNQRKEHTAIRNNIGPARAWRAPNHPQAAVLTMCALDDLAAKLNMDPVEFFGKNLDIAKPRQDIYREELAVAADLMGWKQKWHPRRPEPVWVGARSRCLVSHLGRTRPRQRLRPNHPSGWLGGAEARIAGSGNWDSHVHSDRRRRHPGPPDRRHPALDRRYHVPAFRWLGGLNHHRRGKFLHPPGGSGRPRCAFHQGRTRTQRRTRPARMRECASRRQGRLQPFAQLEGSLLQTGSNAAYDSWQESRQEQATRPHQQRRWRRTDGRG